MRKLLPIAVIALMLGGPLVPLVQAGQGSDASFSLFDKKTKKRTRKTVKKSTKRFNKLGRKTIKRASKNVRRTMKDWQRGRR